MAKVPITDLPIHIYTCMTDPARPAVAFIGELPIKFTAHSAMAAHKAADDWRKEEVAKIERREIAKQKRLEGARRAREERATNA